MNCTPADNDLSRIQSVRNHVFFANLLWDVNKALRLGLELSYRGTSYSPFFLDNQAVIVHTQARYKF